MISERELSADERARLVRSHKRIALVLALLGVGIVVVGVVGLAQAVVSPILEYVQIACGVGFVALAWKRYIQPLRHT